MAIHPPDPLVDSTSFLYSYLFTHSQSTSCSSLCSLQAQSPNFQGLITPTAWSQSRLAPFGSEPHPLSVTPRARHTHSNDVLAPCQPEWQCRCISCACSCSCGRCSSEQDEQCRQLCIWLQWRQQHCGSIVSLATTAIAQPQRQQQQQRHWSIRQCAQSQTTASAAHQCACGRRLQLRDSSGQSIAALSRQSKRQYSFTLARPHTESAHVRFRVDAHVERFSARLTARAESRASHGCSVHGARGQQWLQLQRRRDWRDKWS